jgi:DNA-binding GntR family transcriptional regulator
VADLRRSLDAARDTPDFRDLERTLHTEIARLAGNAIADILLCTLSDVFHARAHFSREQRRKSYCQHVALIDAIEARNGVSAAQMVRRIFDDLYSDLMRSREGT